MKTQSSMFLAWLLCVSAWADTNTTTQLTVHFTDGSQLIGKPVAPDMAWDLTSDILGRMTIPVAKTVSVEFATNRSQATLRLANGDILRGQLGPEVWEMETLLGRLTIPQKAVTSVLVRQTGGAGRFLVRDDWDPLPFPITCDWPGPQGELSRATDEGLELRGHPIRSREPSRYPFAWECEVECRDRGHGLEGSDLNFFFFPGAIRRNEEPPTTIRFCLNAQAGRTGLTLYPVLYESVGDKRRIRELWRGQAMPFVIGETYRVRVDFRVNDVSISINDRMETARGITVEMSEAHIQIWNWQPTSRWLVKNPRLQ